MSTGQQHKRKGVIKMTVYKVTKINSENGQEINYGTYTNFEDVKAITKGYKFDGLFYNREGSKFFFIVEEEK
jgi:hypothetical protein